MELVKPLPTTFRGYQPGMLKKRPWLPVVLLLGVLIIGLTVISFLGILRIPWLENLVGSPTIEKSPTTMVINQTETPLAPTITPTGVQIPTETPLTIKPTEITPHFLETAFGDSPTLIIHRVLEGEGYIFLAERYGTSVEAIQKINFNLPDTLLVNKVLVIPVNTSRITELPPFSAFEIEENGLSIEELAEMMSLDVTILRKYNFLPAGYEFQKGEWILIPH